MNEVYINIKNMNECYIKRYMQDQFKKDLVSIEEIIALLEDLKGDYDELEEKFEDLQQDLEDNYIPRPMSDYTGDRYDDRF